MSSVRPQPAPDLVYMSGITPADLGLPSKFTSWRDQQDVAIEHGLSCSTRFLAQAMPTGMGKSLYYIAQALYMGVRTAILTSTKGLQAQLLFDFESIGLVSIKGRNNFQCVGTNRPDITCEDGPHYGCRCDASSGSQSGACPYKSDLQSAMSSRLVVTNYSYWAAVHRYSEGLGDFGLLICDEAHDAPEAICSVMDVLITSREVTGLLRCEWPKQPAYIEGWREFALSHLPRVTAEVDRRTRQAKTTAASLYGISDSDVKVFKAWKTLQSKLTTLTTLRGEWIAQAQTDVTGVTGYKIRLVWPKTYSESILFRGIPHVVFVSATVVPKTLDLLGLKREQYTFHDYPYVFPKSRAPVYLVPTIRMNYKNAADPDTIQTVARRVDEIIAPRMDRKGLIHTTSYARAVQTEDHSAYAPAMIRHGSKPGESAEAIRLHKTIDPPSILVSPSVTTGYDFPMSDCEYQIVVKAPYGDHRDPVSQRRSEKDQNYPHYVMAQVIEQMCGRGMRSPNDQCETFVIDDTVQKLLSWKPGLFAKWFRDLCHVVPDGLPKPPPKLKLLPAPQPDTQDTSDSTPDTTEDWDMT